MITGERAGQHLEGSLVSFLEGLGDLGRPCARGLSVAGLLTILARFLAGKRFILRGERRPLFASGPLLFNVHTNVDINPVTLTRKVCHNEDGVPRVGRVYIYWVYQGGI